MPKVDKSAAEIVRAAAALEDEMAALEALSRTARKIPLNSEKNIARAAAELSQVVTAPERLGARLQELATAMARMQERQQATLEPLATFAQAIQERSQRLDQHMQSFGALGKAAAEASAMLATSQGDRAALPTVEQRLQQISDDARALFDAARADDFPEIAREADVLKQRMASLRKRLDRPA